jgi:hypothetical protein
MQHASEANASFFNDRGQTLDLKWDHEIHDEVFNHGFLKGRPLSHYLLLAPKNQDKTNVFAYSCSL